MKPRGRVQTLTDRDPEDEGDEGERYGPQDVDPPPTQTNPGHLGPLRRQPGARPNAVVRFLSEACFERIPLARCHRRYLPKCIGGSDRATSPRARFELLAKAPWAAGSQARLNSTWPAVVRLLIGLAPEFKH